MNRTQLLESYRSESIVMSRVKKRARQVYAHFTSVKSSIRLHVPACSSIRVVVILPLMLLASAVLSVGLAHAQVSIPAAGIINTVAGTGTTGYSGDGGPATGKNITSPSGVAVDASGNIYLLDATNRIRKVAASTGSISTIAGTGTAGFTGDGGLATNAEINGPFGIAVDLSGNIYFSDQANSRIRKINTAGIITTVAGNGTEGYYTGPVGPAILEPIENPCGIAVDSSGNVYFAELGGGVIREILAANGNLITVAGNGLFGYSGDGGPATSAELAGPLGLAVDTIGNIYIADTNNYRIRKVTASTGNISTIAGTGVAGASGDGGTAISAGLGSANSVAIDSSGNVYIGDSPGVREVNQSKGLIYTIAGNAPNALSPTSGPALGDGGTATSAQFAGMLGGVATDNAGDVYISDTVNNRIRVVGKPTHPFSLAVSCSPHSVGYTGAFNCTSPVSLGASGTMAWTVNGNAVVTTSLINGSSTQSFSGSSLGTLSIAVSYSGDSNNAAAEGSTSVLVVKGTPSLSWTTPASVNYGTPLSSTQLNATASVPGTFTYSPAAGVVPATGTGTLSVAFTPTNTTDYTSASTTVSLTVNKATPTVSWPSPSAITYGTALSATQLDATSTLAGTFVYSPALGSVPAAGSNTLSATFTPTDATDYTAKTQTVSLVVNQATPTITLSIPTSTVTFGGVVAATISVNCGNTCGAGAFIVDGVNTGHVPLSSAGTYAGGIQFSSAGTHTIQAEVIGNSNYNAAYTSVQTVTITKATPTVTWSTPAAITYGTALSASQLNASASVAGTFVYSPALGTIPTAGTDILSVTFTPTDTTDYNTSVQTVSLVVGKATPVVTWTPPAAISYGTALSATQLNATASVPGTFAYSPALGASLPAGTDTLSVTFTPTSPSYATVMKTVALLVNQASQTIIFSAPASPLNYGASPVGLSATGGGSGNPIFFSIVSGPGTISESTLTLTGVGTVVVAANEAGNANYAAAAPVKQSVVVNGASQTIHFTAPPSPVVYGITPMPLSATGGASGNPVIFSIFSGPGAISGNSLSVSGIGTVVVAANQAGNAQYAAAPQVTQTIAVNSASQASNTAGTSQTAMLKYKIMGVVYAPPGSASSVTYGNSNLVGSTDTMSYTNSSTNTTTLSVSVSTEALGLFNANASYEFSDGWTTSAGHSNSVAVQTSTGNSVSTLGPISSSLGVDHDNDVIYLWLNPVVTGTSSSTTSGSTTTTSLNWTGLQSNSCDARDSAQPPNFQQAVDGCDPNQFPYPDIVGIPVWCLKNPYSPYQGCAQWLPYTSRTWDLTNWGTDAVTGLPLGPGLTMRDYADILEADPFVALNGNSVNICHPSYGTTLDPNVPETVASAPLTPAQTAAQQTTLPGGGINFANPIASLNAASSSVFTPVSCTTQNSTNPMYRFQPYGSVEYPVPGPNGLPSTYAGNFQYSQTQTSTNIATDSHTVSQSSSVGGGAGFLGIDVSAKVGNSNSTTWQQESSSANTSGSTASAAYSITGPQLSDNYVGPATYNVYLDNVYGTYAFYSDLEAPVTSTQLGNIGITITNNSGTPIACFAASPLPCYAFPATTVQTAVQWSQLGSNTPVQTVTLKNNSVYQMTMAGPAVTFSDPGFQVVENDGSDSCSNQQLPSGGICTLHIIFEPVPSDAPNLIGGTTQLVTANILAAGTVNVITSGSNQNLLVSNYGIVSGIAKPGVFQVGATLLPATQNANAPNAYIFPASSYTSQTETFTFTNYSSSTVGFASYPNDMVLTDTSDFSILNATGSLDSCSGAQVPSNGTCSFTLQFLPTTLPASGVFTTRITATSNGQTLAVAGVTGTAAAAVTVTADPAGSGPISIPLLSNNFNNLYVYHWAVPITITNNSGGALTFSTNSQPTSLTDSLGNAFTCEADAGSGSNGYFTACLPSTSSTSSTFNPLVAPWGYVFGQLSGSLTVQNHAQTCDSSNVCVPGLPGVSGSVPLTCGTTLAAHSSCNAAAVAYLPPSPDDQGWNEINLSSGGPVEQGPNTFTASFTLPLTGTVVVGGNTQSFSVNVPVAVNGTNCTGSGCPTANIALVPISGTEQSKTVTTVATGAKATVTVKPAATKAASKGTLTVKVGTLSASTSYAVGATGSTVVQALVKALNVKGSPVKATSSGMVLSLTSVTSGAAGNLSLSSTGDAKFAITASGKALAGGKNATSSTTYDAGTVQLATHGVTASATWEKGSTQETVAQALAASVNKVAPAYWTAIADGNVVVLTAVPTKAAVSKTAAITAASTQSAAGIGVTVTDTGGFTPTSFGATAEK